MKLILKTFYYGVVSFLLVIATSLVLPALPISGNYQVKVVLSGSMEPALGVGSVAYIRSASEYKVGDIITFTNNTFRSSSGQIIPVTHRIIEIKNEGGRAQYITKGDANEEIDIEPVARSAVLGKVFFDLPYVGYAVETARKPYGFMALIIIPAVIIVWDQLGKIWKELAKSKRSQQSYEEE